MIIFVRRLSVEPMLKHHSNLMECFALIALNLLLAAVAWQLVRSIGLIWCLAAILAMIAVAAGAQAVGSRGREDRPAR